jgi:hypothetical protein
MNLLDCSIRKSLYSRIRGDFYRKWEKRGFLMYD